ncbi:hypothetical protein PInf_006267 [Phytophthora infestans]|nr:hypothetical protein PInf_006267 [Phytophthora infestans]
MPSRLKRIPVTFTVLLALSTHISNVNAKTETASNWPSLQFDFTVKRNSMNVYGRSEFTMSINPAVSGANSQVLYDVYSTFSDGSSTTSYMLLNGVGYLSCDSTDPPSVSCLDTEADMLPPVNEIVKAINKATAAPSSADTEV